MKIYSFNPSLEDLAAIKKILAEYFANKLVDYVQTAIEKNNISNEDLESWLNEKS